jgi:hypothetical protein
MQLKRIFMKEEDGSPGGGAAPPPAPAEPTASDAAPKAEPSVPVSQLKAVVVEAFSELRNGLFADLRKAGALGKEKAAAPEPTPAPSQSPPAVAPASTGLSAADVQSMLIQERVFARAEAEHKLTDTQVEWMRSALKGVSADELPTKASSFLRSMGIVKGASEPQPTTAPVPAPQPSGPPISDKGAPAPGGVNAWQREYSENPIGMSPAAVAAMMSEHGAEKARRMIVEAGMRQAERIKLQSKPTR